MTLDLLYQRAACVAPSSPALIGIDGTVTWREAETIVSAIAAHLIAEGVQVGERVAVARLKGAESYLAAHGILRAGAVVVPIDPLAPGHHGRKVLEDADVSAVISDARTAAALDLASTDRLELRTVIIDGLPDGLGPRFVEWADVVSSAPGESRAANFGLDDMAYVIYTSGSTGLPKGIVHTHRSALAYAERAAAAHLRDSDRVAGISGFHYDMSTFELYAAPLAGVPVAVMSEAHLRFPASFLARSADEGVTVWYAVTSMLRQVVDSGAAASVDTSALRSIMYAGESYPPGALRSLIDAFPEAELTNVYGPAEVNECSYHVLTERPSGDDDIPIGAPWADAEAKVIDETGAEVAGGETGELWVSAPTAMRGYWRQPDLTTAALHPRDNTHPWYATGDLVSRDSDGVLWFKGRADNQIKLRGIRTELDAIESVVADAPGVIHAVVAVIDQGSPEASLAAAVVLGEGHSFDEKAIRHFCSERLPAPLVPRSIATHEIFPVTPSGKIDRTAVRRLIEGQNDRSKHL